SEGPSFVSHLPIAFDATASGIQHLCAMTRADEGALVNLSPSPVPRDVYQTVTERVWDEIEALLENEGWGVAHLFGRAELKSVVMTRFYNSTLWGMTQQIINTREQNGWPVNHRACSNLAKFTLYAIDEILKKPQRVMAFVEGCAE